ncbi:MBL fold metallo-hydrolase [Paremcibacter congregatus]|uniref:MBL fold metallo-hydrolase n=1 Tax=Paremcibacter congregatus TaxID=2043170 RepID=UPI003A8ED1A7
MIYTLKYVVLTGLLFASVLFPAENGQAQALEVEFIGNEAFRISDGDHTIMTDFPYKSGAYGYMEYEYSLPAETQNVAALITHRHEDHFAPLLFIERGWSLIGPAEITAMMPRSKVIPFTDRITFGAAEITPVKAAHANVEHYTYLVNWQNKKLFFTGDTEQLAVLKNLPELEALFITPWFYRKAILNQALPAAKKIIIYHHTKDEIVPKCGDCIIPLQGQIIILE